MSISALMTALHDLKVEISLTGNDQLKIVAPEGSLGPDMIAQLREHKEALVHSLKSGARADDTFIQRLPDAPLYEVSHAQRRLWILHQMDESKCAYNIFMAYELNGPLNPECLRTAFRLLVARHEILRTVFVSNAEDLWQKVLEPETAGFAVIEKDMREADEAYKQQQLAILADAGWKHQFDLETGPLLRVQLVALEEQRHVLMMGMHHIISDGWSLEIMMDELVQLYESSLTGMASALPALRVQYRDFSGWQNRLFESPRMQAHKQYWNRQLADGVPVLNLATDMPRPARKTYEGVTSSMWLDTGECNLLRAMLHKHRGSSMFMALVACVKALLFRYTGQEDIILGTPVAGRSVEDLSGQIGCYVNTLVLRTRFSGQESFSALLDKVKDVMLNAYEHEVYPFDKLVEDLGIVTDPSRSALFDAMITYRKSDAPVMDSTGTNNAAGGSNDGELQMRSFSTGEYEISKFDITFNFEEYHDSLWIGINYSTDLFCRERIDRMLVHLRMLIKAVCTDSRQPLTAIAFLPQEESNALLSHFPAAIGAGEAATLHGLFEVQAARMPEHTALVCEGERITYETLNRHADEVAATLAARYGVKPGDLVGIMMTRSAGAVAGLLGILKCGAAYLPVDPGYPEERIQYMMADSGARIVLTDQLYEELLACPANPGVYVQQPVSGDSLAYVIYTSGSTGRPKGVMITHGAVLHLLEGLRQEMQLQQNWQYLLTASLSFDAAVKQVFVPLTMGATLHVCRDTADVTSLVAYIRGQQINVLHAMPMLWKEILAEIAATGGGTALCCISSGGDELDRECMEQMKRQFPAAAIYNTYGPTEICVNALIYDMQQPGAHVPLLGKCLPGYRAYILDKQGKLMPAGYPGELCIAGTGLAWGYLGQEQLTQERFVADPYKPGALMYRTGDLARWTWDGNIEFLGRNDHQVKIRGYRIETGEIERVLAQYEGVQEAVVTAWRSPSGEKELVGYAVWKDQPDEAGLRKHLHRYLPGYMHPAHHVALDRLPLNGNGKVDRNRLPAPVQEISSRKYEAPRNGAEALLVKIWEEILQRRGIGIHDNFFEHGGHSLKGMRMLWRIRQEFGVEIPFRELFSHPTISGLSTWLRQGEMDGHAAGRTAPEPLPPADKYALSHAQQRLWILDQLEESVTAYNILTGYELKGSLDVTALDAALKALVERHEILRTVFRSDAQGPWQYVLSLAESGFAMIYMDLSDEGVAAQQQKLTAVTALEREHRFELDSGPLFRVQLVRLSAVQHILLLNMHHIITDGWSLDVLQNDLVQLYIARQQDSAAMLPQLRVQYKDYAAWQHQQLTGAYGREHAQYWQNQLGGNLPVLELPADYTRPRLKTFNGATLQHWLEGSSYDALRSCLRSHSGSSMFMLLVAGLKALCYRYTGQEDIVLGTPVAGRDHEYLSGQVGFYVNTLVLRTRFDGNGTFGDLLHKVQETVLNAYEHQCYPFDKLLEDLDVTPDRSRSALFDVMVSYAKVNNADADEAPDALRIMEYETGEVNMSKFDLTVHFTEYPDKVAVAINYNTDLFSRERIISMHRHLSQLLEAVAGNVELPLSMIPYLAEDETQQLLTAFNDTAADYPRDATVHDLFAAQVARTPHAAAVVFGETRLTYAELDTLAERAAAALQQVYGVKSGSLVSVMMDRSDRLIICLLGILKCGAAYVPVDPAYPADRIRYMLEDSRPAVVLSDSPAGNDLQKHIPWITYEHLISHNCSAYTHTNHVATDLAYVIYTSGSSGRPKGVMVEHRSVVNLCYWHRSAFELSNASKASVYAGVAFDALGWEIWPYLLTGGCLFPVAEQYRTNARLMQTFLEEHGITHAFLPTALYEELGSHLSLPADNNIRLLVGGDKLNRIYPGATVINNYGPTESTVVATSAICRATGGKVTIGRPVSNTRIYIVDRHLKLMPIGCPGELCIAGESLARGYLGQEQLTRERFVDNPFEPGARMYKTGDIARWTPDGNIEFLGRNDHQVKIRGYRIETGEIERVLQQYAGVREALVTTWEPASGEKELVSYLVWEESPDEPGLRAWLELRLPRYMHPVHYIALDRLPLTGNGKVDRRQLPAPALHARSRQYEGPRNEAQQQLIAIWEEILQRREIGIHDNFFDLGGHSLKGMRMLWRLRQEFDVDIPFHELFSYPTVNTLSTLLSAGARQPVLPLEPVPRKDKYHLSHAQRRLWVLDHLEESATAYNILTGYELEGEMDRTMLETAFTKLVHRHEILRTVFISDEEGQWQHIRPAAESACGLLFMDLTMYEPAAKTRRLESLRAAERDFRFDLEQGPLFRVHLVRLNAARHILLINFHHIIADGWSMEVLRNDLEQLYAGATLPPLPVQYKDYADWHNRLLAADEVHGRYWKEQLAGGVPLLELPADYTRPPVKTYHGAVSSAWLDNTVYAGLRSCLQESKGSSMFMLLVAGLKALFYRYTGQEDIVVGTPVAGRDHEYLSGQIGFYVNTLVLRTRFNGTGTFQELLEQVREVMLHAYAHQAYPFDKLVEDMDLAADRSRTPLFDIMVSYTRLAPAEESSEAGPVLQVTEHSTGQTTVSKFDMTVHFTEHTDGIHVSVTYNTGIFKKERITRMLEHLQELFTGIGACSSRKLSEMVYISEPERNILLGSFSYSGSTPYPAEHTIHGLFEDQVLRMGESPAVIYNNRILSYAALNREADRVASYLRNAYGVRPGHLVGLMMDRSERLMVCLMGILKAGAAYVPIDPEYPADRIRYMLEDSAPKVLITDREPDAGINMEIMNIAGEWELLSYYHDDEKVPVDSHSPAYVIYTSGSTGHPKGAMIAHHSVVNLCAWLQEQVYTPHGGQLTAMLTASVNFDASVQQLFAPLLSGARLVMISEADRRNAERYIQHLQQQQVSVIDITPGYLRVLLEVLKGAGTAGLSLQYVLVGGEALPTEDRALFYRVFGKKAQLINVYGVTEATVNSTYEVVAPGSSNSLCIGRPLKNTRIYVLDRQLNLCGIGIPGELCIGGVGVGLGYLGREELTRERFIDNPYVPGERLYRTGDLARWAGDGTIEYLGRGDNQVKIRGYRIEPGEVENVLQGCPAVREAIVEVHKSASGDKALVSYIVWNEAEAEAGLQDWLRQKLPRYMHPAYYITLDYLPLTANGKVDRKQLPLPETEPAAVYEAPRNPMEITLADIWEEVLQRRPIGIRDNFFALGGHSLKGIRLMARIAQTFNRRVSIRELYEYPDIATLAAFLERPPETEETLIFPFFPRQDAHATPVIFIPPIIGSATIYQHLAEQLRESFTCYGMQYQGFGGGPFASSVEEMASSCVQQLLERIPADHFILLGYSMGALIAYEAACLLEAQGRSVTLLLVDKELPAATGGIKALPAAEVLDQLFEKEISSWELPEGEGRPDHHHLKEMFQATYRIMRAYNPSGFINGNIIAFEAAGRNTAVMHEWQRFTRGDFEYHRLEGDHYHVIQDPRLPAYMLQLEYSKNIL
ncbi:non-ribosomal peptide synthetase [Chitinophaga japonensis]|uniref:Amino acid adenylation domain-containing protein n=1 Tax=Chitinophaga japonensis TaxID=104662 RepID=A0A562SLE6_CHIJA|nr:non-ribosomal peptide synthetase [Chitinophaga japonensis]TWI82119.1 amino acid adenylation domain-containing protein [Chitinophaga japonensis]